MSDLSHSQLPSLEEFYEFDFRELPIGVYMTSYDGQFIIANKTIRKMFDLPLDGLVEANIVNYYANLEDRKNLIKRAVEADKEGNHLERQPIHFRVYNRDLYVEDYCQGLRDPATGKVIGFVGCMVDVSSDFETRQREKELQNRVEELTFDIGRILHANNTTLVMVIQSLANVAQALVPNPFPDMAVPSAEESDAAMVEQADHLSNVIEQFLQVADKERRLKAIPEPKWRMMAEQVEALHEFRERIPVAELRPAALRTAAHAIGQICQNVTPGFLPREVIRELQRAAWHLEQVTVLIDVLKTRSAVLQMEYTLQSLREYVTADVREISKKALISTKSLIDQTISRLTGYAQSQRVEIETHDITDIEVNVNEREVVRALANLLHNAIKYTWRRDRTKAPWVSIHTSTHQRKLYIEFENWGVPISREELEQDLVFKLGYRGQWATDRGRLGTGIGLTDARRIAELHGGGVFIESRPTRIIKEKDPNYYQQPFITKVTFYIPLAGNT